MWQATEDKNAFCRLEYGDNCSCPKCVKDTPGKVITMPDWDSWGMSRLSLFLPPISFHACRRPAVSSRLGLMQGCSCPKCAKDRPGQVAWLRQCCI